MSAWMLRATAWTRSVPLGRSGEVSWTGQLLRWQSSATSSESGGDDDAVELRAGGGGVEDPGQHGASGDGAEDFTGETSGGEAGGNDAEDGQGACFAGLGFKAGITLGFSMGFGVRDGLFSRVGLRLFGLRGIKYDGKLAVPWRSSSLRREFCAGITPYTLAV